MMRANYPQFAHYRKAVFGPCLSDHSGQNAQVPIVLTGQDGVTVHAVYYMVLEGGMFRVSGVDGGIGPGRLPAGPGPPRETI